MDDEDDIQIDLGFEDEDGAPEETYALENYSDDAIAAAGISDGQLAKVTSSSADYIKRETDSISSKVEIGTQGGDGDSKALVQVSDAKVGKKRVPEGSGNVVHVSNLAWHTTDLDVQRACTKFGTVQTVKFFEDRANGRSAGACAVEFATHQEARACIEGLDGKKVANDDVKVGWPGKRLILGKRQFPEGAGPGGPMGPHPRGMEGPIGPMGPGARGPMMGPMGGMGGMMGPMRPPLRPPMGMGPMMRARPPAY